ncbi:hypothetical protein COCMIDRAFT_21864 [Bipolaris oryzae ATCC 44560]|uniref:Uncharacterized protein n=1 Tax=Bipolaris oryzae ATCC 44560 TaxID=930090 RepID=W6ZKD5_COCMI|nr:uncharacterized protein COCMIDRAFT_21864 [Bipolaris oryzae ATCC 44560]EUC50545.1 hypothetical protein COCMIDRAFT_21864 [Bipolaris oryzae ATCC 44560]
MATQPFQIHTDDEPPSPSTASTSNINLSTSILTPHQNTLLRAYLLHHRQETELMNLVVSLETSVRRERDQQGVEHLERNLARAQLRLAGVREERRRAEARVGREMERLRGVVGKARVEARMQGEEMRRILGRERGGGVVCLR